MTLNTTVSFVSIFFTCMDKVFAIGQFLMLTKHSQFKIKSVHNHIHIHAFDNRSLLSDSNQSEFQLHL